MTTTLKTLTDPNLSKQFIEHTANRFVKEHINFQQCLSQKIITFPHRLGIKTMQKLLYPTQWNILATRDYPFAIVTYEFLNQNFDTYAYSFGIGKLAEMLLAVVKSEQSATQVPILLGSNAYHEAVVYETNSINSQHTVIETSLTYFYALDPAIYQQIRQYHRGEIHCANIMAYGKILKIN